MVAMGKHGIFLTILALVAASALFSSCAGASTGLQCTVRTACLTGETDVLHMSSTTNAHAELPSQAKYAYKVCCSGPVQLGTSCATGTAFLNLYSPTNSHVEEASLGNYANKACISGTQIGCGYATDCSTMGTPAGSATCLASIYGTKNAHISSCTGAGSYTFKVCCWVTDITPPSITLDYAGYTGTHAIGSNRPVTFIATATDAGTGVKNITLYVNSQAVNTSLTGQVTWTSASGYALDQAITFNAEAWDNAGNRGTQTNTLTACKLNSVDISPYDCDPSAGCQIGNKVKVSASLSGSCPSPGYLQIDAASSDGNCRLQATAQSGVSMIGVNATCAGSPCTNYWTVYDVPTSCQSEIVSATYASIREDVVYQSQNVFDLISNPTGSFKLRGGLPTLQSVDASKFYVNHGTTVTIYSKTSYTTSTVKRFECSEAGAGGLCTNLTAQQDPTCTFTAPWLDSREKSVQCWVYDTDSMLYSVNRTVMIRSDNAAPVAAWSSPAQTFYRNNDSNRNILVDVTATDPYLTDGNQGSNIIQGSNCNPSIDGSASSFTGNVFYDSSLKKCSGTIVLNQGASGPSEGMHTFSLDIADNATNNLHTTRNLVVGNLPPSAWINGLPQWENASSDGKVSFAVSWNGNNAVSPDGSNIIFNIQFAVFDSSGTIWQNGWIDWKTGYVGNGSAVFGPDSPIDPSNYDGQTIAFRINATDPAENSMQYSSIPPFVNTTIDVTPPACDMTSQVNLYLRDGIYYAPGQATLHWSGSDSTSGVAYYDVNSKFGTDGPWTSITNTPCNSGISNPITQSSAGCSFSNSNGYVYNFSCRATDAAGNVGDWSDNITVKIDTQPPSPWFQPLHEWMGHNQSEWMGSEYFNLSWGESTEDLQGSGLRCFFVQWKNSTVDWTNLTSSYNPSDPTCLSVSPGAMYYEFGRTNTVLNDNENYLFRIRADDNLGNLGQWDDSYNNNPNRKANTTVDRYGPLVSVFIKDSSGNPLRPGYLDPSKTSYVNITSNASDSISGISSNIISLQISERGSNALTVQNQPSQCVGGWLTQDHSNANSTCTLEADYTEGTVITYTIVATDRANNTNTTTGFITTHPLANFLVHLAFLSLGATADLPVQVRNIGATTQNLTLGLDGYSMASFLPADELQIIALCKGEGRCANITLSPGEQRTIYVRVMGNDITAGSVELNLTAISSIGVTDSDTASIIVSYPADFPAMDAWWAVAIMVTFAAVLFYRTETIL